MAGCWQSIPSGTEGKTLAEALGWDAEGAAPPMKSKRGPNYGWGISWIDFKKRGYYYLLLLLLRGAPCLSVPASRQIDAEALRGTLEAL